VPSYYKGLEHPQVLVFVLGGVLRPNPLQTLRGRYTTESKAKETESRRKVRFVGLMQENAYTKSK
jgi:hypothetical protein